VTDPRGRSPAGSLLATVAAVVLALLCCAGPLVLASGAVAGVGALVHSPWLIAAGAPLLIWVIVLTVARIVRRRRGNTADDRCPPRRGANSRVEQRAPEPNQDPHPGRVEHRSDR
jgi:hypothetical protein